jgi:hypothetical protein
MAGRVRTFLAALSATIASVAVVGLTPTAAHAAGFTVYTMERNAVTPGLAQYGATPATVMYDYFHLTCDSAGCYSNGGALPTQSAYEAKVLDYISQFAGGDATKPLVLDFEDIALPHLTGAAATNALALWKQLITWTHDAAPDAQVGMYGYDWETANLSLTAQLYQPSYLDIFAPRGYWDQGLSQSAWSSRIDQAVANDRSISSTLPLVPFVSPTQFGSTNPYLSGNQWGYVFDKLSASAQGMFVWEPSATDSTACPWVSQNAYEMGVLTGTASSGPLAATATPPSGSCTIARAATTNIPVVVKNTSSQQTSATSMQSVTGLPQGISATWQFWSVPALAPGATWSTTLIVTVPAGETYSTVLTHLRTGISSTRQTFVVTD